MRDLVLRITALGCCAAVLAGCKKSDTQAAVDSAAGATAAAAPAMVPAAPAPIALADVAGKWNMRSVPEAGDTVPTTYVLVATADPNGWTMMFPTGLTVPARVTASGDSIITEAGPYASVRRKGVQVTTNGVLRREGDRLVGTTVAHYKTTGPDSVLRLRTEGARAP